jgi:hypothetical protein
VDAIANVRRDAAAVVLRMARLKGMASRAAMICLRPDMLLVRSGREAPRGKHGEHDHNCIVYRNAVRIALTIHRAISEKMRRMIASRSPKAVGVELVAAR